jgi:hypothetical protein
MPRYVDPQTTYRTSIPSQIDAPEELPHETGVGIGEWSKITGL